MSFFCFQRHLALCGLAALAAACASESPVRPIENSSPQVIFNSDGCSLTLSVFEPVLTPEQLSRVINELENTPVDVFAWCPNLGGDTYTYPTRVGEVAYGDNVSEEEWARNHPRMRWQARNVRGFIEAGHDPVKVLSKRAHALGKQFWVTLRMNDPHEDDANRFRVKVSAFKRTHPELLIGPDIPRRPGDSDAGHRYTYAFNYLKKEVQDHQLALIEELCTNYELDGLDLDFQRGRYYFKAGEEESGKAAMTEFVRAVRRRTIEISSQKNRSFTLSVRVPPNLQNCDTLGLDVQTWIAEELVDVVTPMDSGYLDMNADVRSLAQAAEGTRVKIAGGLETYTRGYGHASLEMLRAAAAGYYQEGAAALYLFNFDCHREGRQKAGPTDLVYGPYTPEEVQALNELHSRQLIAERDKHYFVTRDHHGRHRQEGGNKQLPAGLPETGDSQTIHFTVGDDLEKGRREGRLQSTLLRLLISASAPALPGLRVSLNQTGLNAPPVREAGREEENLRGSSPLPLWVLEYWNPPLQRGRNELQFGKAGAGGDPILIEKIEAVVDYLDKTESSALMDSAAGQDQ